MRKINYDDFRLCQMKVLKRCIVDLFTASIYETKTRLQAVLEGSNSTVSDKSGWNVPLN